MSELWYLTVCHVVCAVEDLGCLARRQTSTAVNRHCLHLQKVLTLELQVLQFIACFVLETHMEILIMLKKHEDFRFQVIKKKVNHVWKSFHVLWNLYRFEKQILFSQRLLKSYRFYISTRIFYLEHSYKMIIMKID